MLQWRIQKKIKIDQKRLNHCLKNAEKSAQCLIVPVNKLRSFMAIHHVFDEMSVFLGHTPFEKITLEATLAPFGGPQVLVQTLRKVIPGYSNLHLFE